MPGLNSILSNTTNQTTSLPSWYDTAQQNIASQAQTAGAAVPNVAGTVVGNEVNKLNSAQNPFGQAQTTLGAIASGAANPWITDAAGNVTPNINTAMGGLYSAQKAYLNSILPDIDATASAGSIGSGNFGSRMNVSAVEKARAQAANQLFQNQMQSALSNQQTGAQAASGLGTTGLQEAQTNLGVGQFQQNSPLAGITGVANVINPIRTGTTVSNQTQLAPLQQVGALGSLLGGVSAGGILGQLFGSSGSGTSGQPGYIPPNEGLFNSLSNWWNKISTPTTNDTSTTSDTSTGGEEQA
jgi:hypothetical protein